MKIAIRGHKSRGKEVIQILESLGGINIHDYLGSNDELYYEIYGNSIICLCTKDETYKYYTLEEFEQEFPFKIGDEVIFPVINGWASGKITGIKDFEYEVNTIGGYRYVEPHKLSLYPMKEERNITLTLDKAKEWYKKDGELREIALQAFSEKELNPLPRSWEEFCENNPIQDHEAFINYASSYITICKECAGSGLGVWKRKPEKDRCKCVSQKSAEAHLAMIQLEQLRNCWWNSWKLEWDSSKRYCISLCENKVSVVISIRVSRFLEFPTEKMARDFLECFRDLIEKAKDLI